MTSNERRQLHDEIVAGAVDIKDLTAGQLRDFRVDFDTDYQPTEDFFRLIGNELHRRMKVTRKTKTITKNFFK